MIPSPEYLIEFFEYVKWADLRMTECAKVNCAAVMCGKKNRNMGSR